MDDRLAQAGQLYERAVFGGDAEALDEAERLLTAVEADVALGRGQVIHARFAAESAPVEPVETELALLERASALYRSIGDVRGQAEAQFWIGAYHQVVRQDGATAVLVLEGARALATQADDRRIMSYALRHLGIAAHHAGQLGRAREQLEASTRLRRELGFDAGVASNLVGLAYIAAADGRSAEVAGILDEADRLARTSGAAAINRQVVEARQHLAP